MILAGQASLALFNIINKMVRLHSEFCVTLKELSARGQWNWETLPSGFYTRFSVTGDYDLGNAQKKPTGISSRTGTGLQHSECDAASSTVWALLCFLVPTFGTGKQELGRQIGLQVPAKGLWGGDINTCPGTTPPSSIFLFNNNKGIFSYWLLFAIELTK